MFIGSFISVPLTDMPAGATRHWRHLAFIGWPSLLRDLIDGGTRMEEGSDVPKSLEEGPRVRGLAREEREFELLMSFGGNSSSPPRRKGTGLEIRTLNGKYSLGEGEGCPSSRSGVCPPR